VTARPVRALLRASLLLAGLLAIPGSGARGDGAGEAVQVYLKESARAEAPFVTVGDVAALVGGTAEERARLASCRLPLPVTRPTLLPARTVRAALLAAGAAAPSVSGQRVAVIPSAGKAARELLFYERLLRSLDQADTRRDSRLEIELLGAVGIDPAGAGADVRFGPVEAARVSGCLAGPASVAVRSGNGEGSLRIWAFAYVPAEATPAEVELSTAASGDAGAGTTQTVARSEAAPVRTGDAVTIIFRKGSIAISTPGRAQSGGALLDSISVRSVDGRKAFVGTVTGASEVSVDVP
jgi:hypothetical protein